MGRTLGDMYDDEGAREVGWLRRQTPVKLILKVGGALLLLSLCLGGVGWVGGWWRTGVEIVSPENVKKQWEFAYTYDKSLTASATNWCAAQKAEDVATGDAKNERVSQRLAREANYEQIRAAYDAALQNAFKAKLVKPPDVPSEAPTLPEKVATIGCYP